MHYDPDRRAYIDSDTGAIVLQEELSANQYAPLVSPTFDSSNPMARIDNRPSSPANVSAFDIEMIQAVEASTVNTSGNNAQSFLRRVRAAFSPLSQYAAPSPRSDVPIEAPEVEGQPGQSDDWTLARALQSLEFEITEDPYGNFAETEYRASRSCKRQLMTLSFAICMVQIVLMIIMIQEGGYADRSENPVIGPPTLTMVQYGAKQGGLIVYYNEWWRLFTSVMLHAGILHIIPNVAIQMRVGGYLELCFGTLRWAIIYIVSGIYGEVVSCIFLPNAVGVGSSGAIMGMLSAWVVWLVLRWSRIPPDCRSQRNCQLLVVMACIVVTLATSFSPNVDWAAHFGGAVEGALLGCIILADQVEDERHRNILRYGALMVNIVLLIYSFYYVAAVLSPSRQNLDYFLGNDDDPLV